MRNILVVNINWLGDAVFSTPVFKALKSHYPQARIVCLAVPRVAEVLKFCPFIDEIMVYDEKGRDRSPGAKVGMIARLRSRRFEAAFFLHRSMSRALLVFLAGVPVRVGYANPKQRWLLTRAVEEKLTTEHRSDRYLRVVESHGVPVKDRTCELRCDPGDAEAACRFLESSGYKRMDPFAVLNVGGNWDLKRWPPQRFSELIRRVRRDWQLRVVISGGPGDRALAEGIVRDSGEEALVTAGAMTLGQSLALFEMAKVVVSCDSGPLHLAGSVGTPVLGIFGPTRPEVTGPRGIGRSLVLFKDVGCNKAPCYYLECSNNVCMRAVTVDNVCEALRDLIG